MPMQIRGTAAPNSPPAGLAERQLSVEMGSSPPKLWCGVPASIDPVNGRVQLSPPIDYVSQSQLAAYLPLAGGTMSLFEDQPAQGVGITFNSTSWLRPAISMNLDDGAAGISITSASGGSTALNINNGTSSSNVGLHISNSAGDYAVLIDNTIGRAIRLNHSGSSYGLEVQNSSDNAGVYIETSGGQYCYGLWVYQGFGTDNAIWVTTTSGGTFVPVKVDNANAGIAAVQINVGVSNVPTARGLEINGVSTLPYTGSLLALRRTAFPSGTVPTSTRLGDIAFGGRAAANTIVDSAFIFATSTEAWTAAARGSQLAFQVTPNATTTPVTALTIENSGALTVGTPTGPAITGAGNVNVSGYFINGVAVTIGDPDSGGLGFRALVVPN